MTLRWRRTIDEAPGMFVTGAEADDDWLLYSGAWLVGRVSRPGGGQRNVVVAWSLTGPHTPEAPIDKHGDAASVEVAKAHLVEAFRGWAAWAAITPDGTAAPRWARTDAHEPRLLGPSLEADSDWLLLSGGLVVGRVHRPADGPRHDPHWRLGVLSAASPAPFVQQGWTVDVEDARAQLAGTWRAWLAWAELPAVGGGRVTRSR